MTKRSKLFSYLLCLTLMLSLPLSAQNDPAGWRLAKETQKIKVFRRPVAGYAIDEFKGVCQDRVRLEQVGTVLENIPGYVNWVNYLVESRVIRRFDEDNMIVYHRYNVIWPFDDRDCVARVHVKRDFKTGRFVIRITSISDPLVPVRKGTVRIPDYRGRFVIDYIDRAHTRATYIARMDFGGSIPAWFGNLLSREIPFQMLDGLISAAKKKENIDAAEKSSLKQKIEDAIRKGDLKK